MLDGGRPEHRDAAEIAQSAGELLLEIRRGLELGREPREVGAEADRRSNQLILAELARRYPDDPVLSEESADDTPRLRSERVWIVDPLDGTREYSELGRSDWTVHVALAIGGRPAAAAVAMPALGITVSTADCVAAPPRGAGPLRFAVSRSRPPTIAGKVAAILGAELVPMGSAGAKTMAVLRGEVDGYIHAGGQYEWDSAAAVAVALAGGLHCSRLDGSDMRYNREDPWLPDQLVCRQELATEILAILQAEVN